MDMNIDLPYKDKTHTGNNLKHVFEKKVLTYEENCWKRFENIA